MQSRVIRAAMVEGETGDTRLFNRRSMLLGAAGAALSAACGPADELEASELIGTVQQGYTWVTPDNIDFSSVPSWPYSTIVNFFKFARDVRWLRGRIMRRVSWLYPDAGCEARSEIIVHRAGLALLSKPYKILAISDLRVNTNNHPSGHVNWGFHVAPVVKSSGSGLAYVLDPAVYANSPLSWSSWLSRLHPKPISAFAVAEPEVYGVFPGPGGIERALDDMTDIYLPLEWDRQIELGRDPFQVLGDNPPW